MQQNAIVETGYNIKHLAMKPIIKTLLEILKNAERSSDEVQFFESFKDSTKKVQKLRLEHKLIGKLL